MLWPKCLPSERSPRRGVLVRELLRDGVDGDEAQEAAYRGDVLSIPPLRLGREQVGHSLYVEEKVTSFRKSIHNMRLS